MRAMRPTEIVCLGITLVRSKQRHPISRLTDVCIGTEMELRDAALPDIGTVDPRNPQFSGEIRSVIAADHILAHAGVPESAIEDQIWRKNPGVTDGRELLKRMARASIAADADSYRCSERRLGSNIRIHDA